MKLDDIGSYDRDVRFWRNLNYLFFFVLILCACGMTVYLNAKQDENIARKRIVIDQENRPLIATERALTRDERFLQYRRFWSDWYQAAIGFDASSFEKGGKLDQALNCMTKDAGTAFYIREFKEKPLAQEVRENNWRTEAKVLRVEFVANTSPVKGQVFGVQTLIRPSGSQSRRMNVNFVIHDVGVTYENPYGVMIEELDIFDNTPLRDSTNYER